MKFDKPVAKNQHYVPQFILRNFINPENNNKIWGLCIKTGKIFSADIKTTCTERYFYNFRTNENSLEEYLSYIEGHIDQAIKEILTVVDHTATSISNDSITLLYLYRVLQVFRAPFFRNINNEFYKILASHGMPESIGDLIQDDRLKHLDVPEILLNSPKTNLVNTINYDYVNDLALFEIFKATQDVEKYTSDTKLYIMLNKNNNYIINDSGFSVINSDFYLPIAKNILLIFRNIPENEAQIAPYYTGYISDTLLDRFNKQQIGGAKNYVFANSKEALETCR